MEAGLPAFERLKASRDEGFRAFLRSRRAQKAAEPAAPAVEEDTKEATEVLDPAMVACVADAQRRRRLAAVRVRAAPPPSADAPADSRRGVAVEQLGHVALSYVGWSTLGRLRVAGALTVFGEAAARELRRRTSTYDFGARGWSREGWEGWGWGRLALEASRRDRYARASRSRFDSSGADQRIETKALCNCAKAGDVAGVRWCLEDGDVDVDAPNWEASPMGWACGGGHEEVVLLLYAHGADATEEGMSEYNGRRLPPLLTLAAERDRVRVVHLLCLLGGHAPEDGAVARDDALAAAANRGHAGVVEYLALAGGRSLGTMRHMTRSPLRVARLFGHAALERSMYTLSSKHTK